MLLIITISLLVISSSGVAYLLFRDDLENRYPLGRLLLLTFGVGVVLFGVCFFQKGWSMSAFFGTLFLILGSQITLWAVGISLDFLGNVPTSPEVGFDSQTLKLIELADEAENLTNEIKEKNDRLEWETEMLSLKHEIREISFNVESLSNHIKYIEDNIRRIEHILDPEAKKAHDAVMKLIEDAKNQQS
jgi:hypothetical protein